MNVRSSMTPNPQTIGPTDLLSLAQEKMQRGRFRRLPVVDDAGTVVGVVTDGDVREHSAALPSTPVQAAMGTPPITVNPDAAVDTAASIMLERKIDALP